MTNATHHNKSNLGGAGVYNYQTNADRGMDLRLLFSQGAGDKAAILDNLYRDKTRPYKAVETFPGYRRLEKSFGSDGERVNGIFTHSFDGEAYVYLHRGPYLYAFLSSERDRSESLSLITRVADAPSRGVSFGGRFYFFDGERILRFASPREAVAWGDEAYTEEMEDLGTLPDTDVYIPLISVSHNAYEARNILTNYYRVEDTTKEAFKALGVAL